MSTEGLSPRQKAAATKKARTRRLILEAVRPLFDEHGYHGVTRDDLMAAAGVGSATMYSHFPTKQALAIAAYAPPILEAMGLHEKYLAESSLHPSVIVDFIYMLADRLHNHPTMAYALLPLARDHQAMKSVGDAEPVLDVSFRQVAEFLGKLLERRERADQCSVPTAEVADFFLSGLLTWIVQHPDRSGEDTARIVLARLL